MALKMMLLGVALLAVAAPLVAGYDKSLDKFDVDKVLRDDALLNEYVDCFLDKGPCKAEYANEIRKNMQEVIATACEKCTPVQKSNTRKFVNGMYQKKPNLVLEFHKKYDPTSEYEEKFGAFLAGKE